MGREAERLFGTRNIPAEHLSLPRDRVVDDVVKELRERRVLLLRGAQGCGKSALGQLLAQHFAADPDVELVFLARLANEGPEEEFYKLWEDSEGGSWESFAEKIRTGRNIVAIFDSVQNFFDFEKSGPWYTLLNDVLEHPEWPSLVLLLGALTATAPEGHLEAISWEFHAERLMFNDDEVDELIRKFNLAVGTERSKLDNDDGLVRDMLMFYSGGHPGMVTTFLNLAHAHFLDESELVGPEKFSEFICCRVCIEHLNELRFTIDWEDVPLEGRVFLCWLIESGGIVPRIPGPHIDELIDDRILQTSANGTLSFPSPFHQTAASLFLYQRQSTEEELEGRVMDLLSYVSYLLGHLEDSELCRVFKQERGCLRRTGLKLALLRAGSPDSKTEGDPFIVTDKLHCRRRLSLWVETAEKRNFAIEVADGDWERTLIAWRRFEVGGGLAGRAHESALIWFCSESGESELMNANEGPSDVLLVVVHWSGDVVSGVDVWQKGKLLKKT